MIFVLGKSKISVEVGLGCNLTKAVNLLKNPGPINLTSTFNNPFAALMNQGNNKK